MLNEAINDLHFPSIIPHKFLDPCSVVLSSGADVSFAFKSVTFGRTAPVGDQPVVKFLSTQDDNTGGSDFWHGQRFFVSALDARA
jgi:hypothetical protein